MRPPVFTRRKVLVISACVFKKNELSKVYFYSKPLHPRTTAWLPSLSLLRIIKMWHYGCFKNICHTRYAWFFCWLFIQTVYYKELNIQGHCWSLCWGIPLAVWSMSFYNNNYCWSRIWTTLFVYMCVGRRREMGDFFVLFLWVCGWSG